MVANNRLLSGLLQELHSFRDVSGFWVWCRNSTESGWNSAILRALHCGDGRRRRSDGAPDADYSPCDGRVYLASGEKHFGRGCSTPSRPIVACLRGKCAPHVASWPSCWKTPGSFPSNYGILHKHCRQPPWSLVVSRSFVSEFRTDSLVPDRDNSDPLFRSSESCSHRLDPDGTPSHDWYPATLPCSTRVLVAVFKNLPRRSCAA